MNNIEKKVDQGFEAIMKKFEEMDERYASKLTEKIVYGLVSIILVAVSTALVYLVIQK